MSSVNYTNQILDAVETVAKVAIEAAGYNKTIQATIIQKMNTSGKYKVKYQDSELIVYSNNTDIDYPVGTLVYVLIPNGDFSLNKMILDVVDKEQTNYTVPLNAEDNYINISGNTTTTLQEFALCSYKQAGANDEFDDQIILYDRDNGVDNINLNKLLINDSLFKADNILCGAQFKTNLKPEQQMQGNYGLIFEIDFKNSNNAITTKRYVLDINSIIGQPYNLTTYTRQYKIFKIDTENFDSIKKVLIFSDAFPNSATGQPKDIFVKELEFSLMKQVAEDSYIVYIDKDKPYFDTDATSDSVINLNATVRLKNKVLNDDLIEYYWFKENSSIDTTSDGYLNYGGIGWECLNSYIDNDSVRKYNSSQNLIFAITQAVTLETRIKCVAVRNGIVFASEEDMIKNYSSLLNITIESDEGTNFYYDNGSPTLTCLINGVEDITNYDYIWTYIDNNNSCQVLEETTTLNTQYHNAVTAYENLKTQVETGLANAAASQATLDEYLETIENIGQRIEKNKVCNIDLTQIYNNGIFKCSVVDKSTEDVVGTAMIEITNEMKTEGVYLLEIVNGVQTFHYNENGIAPTHESLDDPITLKPLSFNIYDNNGKKFSQHILDQCEVEWVLPQIDTLISSTDLPNNHTYTYTIADVYDEYKIYNNNIGLIVKYKDLMLRSSTSFTFAKDGDPSYNGSNVITKIVPNINSGRNCYPMVVNGVFNFGILDYDKTSPSETIWFNIQVWKEGIKIYEGHTNSTDAGIDNLKWKVLKNKYSSSVSDPTNLTINETTGVCSWSANASDTVANIVQASFTFENKTYYATLPIISVSSLATDYSMNLKQGSGFINIMYENDNTQPRYSTNEPFTIEVRKTINGYVEDISTVDNDEKLSYTWSELGQIYNGSTWVDAKDFKLLSVNSGLTANQKKGRPNEKYSGETVTNAIKVIVKKASNNSTVGIIHIPLYFYINKFGLSALEMWNGNSVAINDTSGGYILSPQVGAGELTNSGNFTGLLMGKVKEADGSTKVGLLGLYDGDQTIFLDAENGKATFGQHGHGQVVIDGSSAVIEGGSYSTSGSGSGMKINLGVDTQNPQDSGPYIKYGSGKFMVDKDGKLIASEATINGTINAISGTFGNGTNKITIGTNNTSNSAIYYGKTNFNTNAAGFYIGTDGIALGAVANGTSAFQVTTAGALTAKSATINGTITAGAGSTIGPWTVTANEIYNGKSTIDANSDGVYLGKDGISLGANSPFKVTKAGYLLAQYGKVGGWNLSSDSLHTANNALFLGISGISATIGGISRSNLVFKAGNNFGVNSDGDLFCNNAIINGNMVTGDGVLTNLYFQGVCGDGNDIITRAQPFFVGFGIEMNFDTNKYQAFKRYLDFNVVIPTNFSIVSAKIIFYHEPVKWYKENTDPVLGSCTKLHAYTVDRNGIINASFVDEYKSTVSATEELINSFSEINFSTSAAQTLTSSNFASVFQTNGVTNAGNYIIRCQTSQSIPASVSEDRINTLIDNCAPYSGYLMGTLIIMGYTKLS